MRLTAAYGYSGRDVPEIRDWIAQELQDDGRLWMALAQLDMSFRASGQSAPTTVEVERRGLDECKLFWVPSDTCQIIEDARTDVPPEIVYDENTLPTPFGLVVFEKALTGIAAPTILTPGDQDRTITTLRMLKWTPVDLIHPGDEDQTTHGVGLSWWAHTADLAKTRPVLRGASGGWLPLGRTDWCVGQGISDVFTEHMGLSEQELEQFRASAVEDRARAMVLWALMNTQPPNVSLPLRQERRQAARRGAAHRSLNVNVVTWNPARHIAETPESDDKRKVNVRYHVDAFWARRAYGPKRSLRKWTYIPAHWRGPEGAPISTHRPTVRKVVAK